MTSPAYSFASRGSPADIEKGQAFQPKFDADGLIPAIVTDATTQAVLMFAWMNAEALALTISTRRAHFWSRSKRRLWVKGEESGNRLDVVSMAVDCDQDVLLLSARIEGDGVACHTGAPSCFYRSVPLGSPPTAIMQLTPNQVWKA
ncbi:MAG: phosphoribosyl-AMP cyclohydrolase [Hyphomicrobium sp.]